VPSTNNAIEATNNAIKKTHTRRERFTLSVFIGKMFDMLKEWSVDRKVEAKPFAKAPELTECMWKLTDTYISEKPKVKCIEKDRERRDTTFLIGDKETPDAVFLKYNQTICKHENLTEKFSSFEELRSVTRQVKHVKMNRENWVFSECSCSSFFKFFMCKHIAYLAIKLKLAVLDEGFKHIGAKTKRGRKKKAAGALERQDEDAIVIKNKRGRKKPESKEVTIESNEEGQAEPVRRKNGKRKAAQEVVNDQVPARNLRSRKN
jgi:hypothetical protein